jgi:4-hydroxy 2-oxovalerate aldolase
MELKILDCTLRDGGYINNWQFSEKCVINVIRKLDEAHIDIIEAGFLDETSESDKEVTLFSDIKSADEYLKIANIKKESNCVLMVMHGKYDVEKLPNADHTMIKGIRYCFKKDYIDSALENCKRIYQKGYDVYLQPAALTDYSDKDILELTSKSNELDIKSFYIVDTFGVMRQKDVIRYFYILDKNLRESIPIGFHSHNNLQLSFSNALALMNIGTSRSLYIDTSVFGMGRGAGNLCTELFIQHVNENVENRYDIIPILEIMDEYIMPIYSQHPWGYSAPYYIAAINNCHPNYATYLMNMQTLFIRDINSIIQSIPGEKKHIYDETYIYNLYLEYQKQNIDDSTAVNEIREYCFGRDILILAPGKSVLIKEKTVKDYIEKNSPVIFAVNHIPEYYNYDKVFFSNLKRFKDINDVTKQQLKGQIICTSNITISDDVTIVNYSGYLNEDEIIADNAGLMLINLLRKIGVKKVALAGFDGFNYLSTKNYYDDRMISSIQYEKQERINRAISTYFDKLKKLMDVKFVTPSLYCDSSDVC